MWNALEYDDGIPKEIIENFGFEAEKLWRRLPL